MPIPLSMESIGKLSEGIVGKQVESCLAEIFKDLSDRGHDKKPRKLTIELSFASPSGGKEVTITPKVSVSVPKHVPEDTIASLDMAVGGMLFSPSSAANPNQKTFDEVVDDRGEVLERGR